MRIQNPKKKHFAKHLQFFFSIYRRKKRIFFVQYMIKLFRYGEMIAFWLSKWQKFVQIKFSLAVVILLIEDGSNLIFTTRTAFNSQFYFTRKNFFNFFFNVSGENQC